MIPPCFQGAWTRHSIAVDGGPPAESAAVIWVQSQRCYADLRLAHHGGGAVAFAGITQWSEPELRWCHAVDLGPKGPPDVGLVQWDGGDLIEEGTLALDGRMVPYVERWRRVYGSDGPRLAMWAADGSGVLVRAGDHSLTVVDQRPAGGAFRACYRTLGPDGWRTVLGLGPEAEGLPGPPAEPPPVGSGTVWAGVRWTVCEHVPT